MALAFPGKLKAKREVMLRHTYVLRHQGIRFAACRMQIPEQGIWAECEWGTSVRRRSRENRILQKSERDSCSLLQELHPKACWCADGEEASPCVVVLLLCFHSFFCLVMHLFSIFFSFFFPPCDENCLSIFQVTIKSAFHSSVNLYKGRYLT